MAATPAIVAVSAGSGTAWSFVVATVLALLIASCIAVFTKRMATAGGLYSLIAQGLPPGAAYSSAVASTVGYGLLGASGLAGATLYGTTLLRELGVDGGRFGAVVLTLVIGAAVAGLALRGARASARIVLLVELFSVTLMLGILVLILVRDPAAGGAGAVVATRPEPGISGVVAGVLPALAAFIGFEIATALGAESARPLVSIPRAVGATAALTGVLYVFAAQTQTIAFAPVGGLAGQEEPIVVLAAQDGWAWVPAALDAGLTLSFFASCLAASTALARVVFSLGRDGVLPAPLGRTHRRYRTPHVAVAVAVPLTVVGLAVALALGVPPGTALIHMLTLATCGFLVDYLLVCVAAPLFLRRIGELTAGAVVVSAVIVPVMITVLAAFLVRTPSVGIAVGAIAVVALAGYGWLKRARPAALSAIGVYDEPTVSDVLLPPGRAA
jgi:amino acid transporter